MGCGSKIKKNIKKIAILTTPFFATTKITGKVIGLAGGLLEKTKIGSLEKIGEELNRVATQFEQVEKVILGEYKISLDSIQAEKEKLKALEKKYFKLVEEVNGEAFLGEIFSIAGKNELERFMNDKLIPAEERFKKLVENFKREFSYILDWAEGSFFERLFASFILIIGGLLNDVGDIVTGEANSNTWKNIISTMLTIIVIVVLALAQQWWAVTILVANLIITLDATYANGTMLGAIFSLLDFVFNDVLNLDDLIGSDFDHFNKDSEYYEETQAYFRLTLAITAVIASLNVPSEAWKAGMANMGLGASTLSATSAITDAYNAYNVAISINDIVTMNDKYNEMHAELKEKQNILDSRITSANRRKMIGSYIDMEHILAYPDEMVNEYVMQMTQLNNGVLDPEGLISMNTRYKVENQEMNFGFEDIFAYDNQAGGNRYTKQILFKTY